MEHIDNVVIQAYVNDHISETERASIEEHLAVCDTCLESYFDIVDQWTLEAPSLSDDFTDQTIDQILTKQVMPPSKDVHVRTTKRRSTIMNYSIAAGLTIILMFTGVFQQMVQMFDQDTLREQPSISNQIIKQTSDWLDRGISLEEEDTNE